MDANGAVVLLFVRQLVFPFSSRVEVDEKMEEKEVNLSGFQISGLTSVEKVNAKAKARAKARDRVKVKRKENRQRCMGKLKVDIRSYNLGRTLYTQGRQ